MKLRETLGPVTPELLAPHLARDAVFVVAPSLDLLDCGVAVAMDDVTLVQQWIERGELRRPARTERERWATAGSWLAVIVQPYVLVQVTPEPAAGDPEA